MILLSSNVFMIKLREIWYINLKNVQIYVPYLTTSQEGCAHSSGNVSLTWKPPIYLVAVEILFILQNPISSILLFYWQLIILGNFRSLCIYLLDSYNTHGLPYIAGT